jgi:hypothetical protein
MLRSRYVRSFLLGSLSILCGLGIGLLLAGFTDFVSPEVEEFWFLIVAFAISIPFNWLFNKVLTKLIGPPEV